MKIFIILIIFLLTSCVRTKSKEEIKIIMPNGAPSLAQIKIENDYKEIEGYKISIDRVGDPRVLATAFSGDNYDLIYAPINLGVKQYNLTKKFKLLGSVTNGNLYFVSKTPINNINDLNNKPLYMFAETTVNASVIKHLLDLYNVVPKNINYLGGTKDTLQQFITSKEEGIYVIAEPLLSAQLSNKGISHYTLDINNLLKQKDIEFIQACVFYKDGIDSKFIDKYYNLLSESINFVNNDPNVLELLKAIDIGVPENINKDIISRCNIKLSRLNKDILDKLIDIDINKFGGKPDETFYY